MPNFVRQAPSLQHLAGIKTVAALWTQSDILKLIAKLSCYWSRKSNLDWKAATEKAESHVLALELTQPCKQELLKLIDSLGNEIWNRCLQRYSYAWYNDNSDYPLLRCMLPREFFLDDVRCHRLCENKRSSFTINSAMSQPV